MFEVYKRGQGKYTRTITFVSAMVIGCTAAYLLSEQLSVLNNVYLQFGLPVVLLVALAAFMFWMVNRPRSADFLIATEGEMKKVAWSSRKEIIGSTKVVIVTTFILAALLFAIDVVFSALFRWLRVMGG